MNTVVATVLIRSTIRCVSVQMGTNRAPEMNPSKGKTAIGCTIAFAIPLLLSAAMVAGLFLKFFNDARVERHLTIWQAIGEWRSSSAAEEARLTPVEKNRRDMNALAKIMACPFAIFMVGGYLVPLLIALKRRHPQTAAIGAVNIFLGWSFLGWVIALTWSLTNENGSEPPIPPKSPLPPRPRSVAPVRRPVSPS